MDECDCVPDVQEVTLNSASNYRNNGLYRVPNPSPFFP